MLPASGCRPVLLAQHGLAQSAKTAWRPGQRLALIESGSVSCLHQETGRATTCVFRAGARAEAGHASARWRLGADGRRYARVGQPIARDGRPGGDHVIAARFVDGAVSCVGAGTSRATTGVPIGQELEVACVVATMNASHNRTGQALRNVSTIPVCTRTHPHPDGAKLLSADRAAGVYCYIGEGAGLNDENGQVRDAKGNHLPGCHVLWHNGLEVFAAKRPAVRGYR
jgi:hypothetical protein